MIITLPTFTKKIPGYENLIQFAKKKRLRYTIYNGDILDCKSLNTIPNKTIIPTRLIRKPCVFDTKFGTHYEQRNVRVRTNAIIVKGPLGEVYQQNDWSKWDCSSSSCKPKDDTRQVIKVTRGLMDLLGFIGKSEFEIRPHFSTDSMAVLENDYIVINTDLREFYRVYGPAFAKTYNLRRLT